MDGTLTLEKIDELRARTGASYGRCCQALEAAGGDVLHALVEMERARPSWRGRLQQGGEMLGERARDVCREALRTRIAVRRGQRTVAQLPAVVGLAGSLLVPWAAAAGLVAALATGNGITVERASGHV